MYNFDEIIDRRNTNAMNTDGFRAYIFGADDTTEFPYKDEEFIRMWVADMDFATPQVIIDAMKERLDKRIFGYTRILSDSYYKAFVNWTQKRYGWSFEREHLVMSNGIIPALFELVDYITKPDEKVFFLTPSYAYFKKAADYHQRESVCADLVNDEGYYTIDFDDFERKAADETTKLFILCNPHNPTGRVWTEEELRKMGEICIKHGVWIISDEIHCDLLRVGQQHIPLAKLFPEYDKLVTAMAPSKTFNMAGLMISNVIIPNDALRETWLSRHYNFDNPVSVAGAQAAYEKGEHWLEALTVYLDDNFTFTKEYLAENLPEAGFEIAESTYLAWVDVSAYFDKDVELPMFFAREAGVLLEGGDMFVQNSDSYIRLNLAIPRSVLAEGLKRICGAIQTKQKETVKLGSEVGNEV
ncbi:MalY/PatB family protein [Sporosarcina soli]|uniref:cysteine-S-conjugate beta-lyase n=1 Tax=Sporosarcina soli TaxID=334736 RepID=A0ABW0TUH5_9BACL